MNKYIAISFCLFLILFGCKTTNHDIIDNTTTTIISESTTTTVYQKINGDDKNGKNGNEVVDKRLNFEINDNTDEYTLEKHMNDLFDTIEEKISKKDFKGWYSSISINYKDFINDEKELYKISIKSPYLSNIGLILKTPEDFFYKVVIEAREGYKLQYIGYEYLNSKNVVVISGIKGFSFKYRYKFTHENGYWKLDR